MDGSSTPPRGPPPKATLFCPDCDRAAPADGGWLVGGRDGEALTCPDCGAVVTVRRTPDAVPA